MKIKCHKQIWNDGVAMLICDGKSIVRALTFEQKDIDQRVEPTMFLSYSEAQELIDELWACGLRPIEAAGSVGALSATQKHLEDMRTLVFKNEIHLSN